MIPVGTVCLLVRDHPSAGRTCTVIGFDADTETLDARGWFVARGPGYRIAIPGEPDTCVVQGHTRHRGALPHHLIPRAPPAPVESHEREAETC